MKHVYAALALALVIAAPGCSRSSVSTEMDKMDAADAALTAKNKAAGEAFLAANKSKPGTITTPSGLQYQVVRAGDASLPRPGPADEVTVNYEGRLIDGRVFDSSYARGQSAQFNVGQVIQAWSEGMQLMRPGEEFILTVPPSLGYGAAGSPPDIPQNAVLIFKVELVSFKRPDGSVVKGK